MNDDIMNEKVICKYCNNQTDYPIKSVKNTVFSACYKYDLVRSLVNLNHITARNTAANT